MYSSNIYLEQVLCVQHTDTKDKFSFPQVNPFFITIAYRNKSPYKPIVGYLS